MPNLNKVMVIGHLGRDPELRSTANGMSVCNFSVAASEKYKDKEHTEWFNCRAWGKTADACEQYLKKGSAVYIEGSLRTESWDDKNSGEKKYRTYVNVQKVQFLGGRNEGGSSRKGGGDNFDWQTGEDEAF